MNCQHHMCNNQAAYSYHILGPSYYCREHAVGGMVFVMNKPKVEERENKEVIIHIKPELEYKEEEDVEDNCEVCERKAVFSYGTDKNPIRCGEHCLPKMISIPLSLV